MSAPPSADRSSIEIKDLLRKLHPSSNNNHKDRIRRLNKFRNYVQPPVRLYIFIKVVILLLFYDLLFLRFIIFGGFVVYALVISGNRYRYFQSLIHTEAPRYCQAGASTDGWHFLSLPVFLF